MTDTRRVELVTIGSELLRLGRPDTNADWLAARLFDAGFVVGARCAVEDDPERIASQIRAAVDRSGRVITTGGLGPTEDDRTREALASALGVALQRDESEAERLRKLFDRHGRTVRASHLRQADRPGGCRFLTNRVGSAAGLLWRDGERWIASLPGVPGEMRVMFEDLVRREIGSGGGGIARRRLQVAGLVESDVDTRLAGLYSDEGTDVTVLAGTAGIEVHVLGQGATRAIAERRADAFVEAAREALGEDLVDPGGASPEFVVGNLLRQGGATVAVAESCTAGLIAAKLTDVPGSSEWFRGGVVVYGDDTKASLLGVSTETLGRHGAVSEPVARELARGVRDRFGADFGVGITGIAGPGGGTADKPVGLVHFAWADGDSERVRRVRLPGDRGDVRSRAVAVALDGLRRWLLADADRRGRDG